MKRITISAIALLTTLPVLTGCGSSFASSSQANSAETFAPGHLVVVYRNGAVPEASAAIAHQAGAQAVTDIPRLGLSAIQVAGDESAAITTLLANPNVAAVLHDRYVRAQLIAVQPAPAPTGPGKIAVSLPLGPSQSTTATTTTTATPTDTYYNSPQGWAVFNAGGFGDNIPNPSNILTGPWNTSRGAGVRIAVLDSGVDQTHPDLAPNLALNLSEVNTTALPSPCDDGSPQDQQGHGSFAASLATAAIGGGALIGVAPQATLLNIKVLERVPGTGDTTAAQCESGQPSGLLSWVLLGINDAIANHANIISMSFGTLVDTATGDGAGWQAQFNAATYAASQSGAVLVAALGNDNLNLGAGSLIELPAQSRNVLPVTASTNPACAENLTANATCAAGPITLASYSSFGVPGSIAAPGGSYPQGSTSDGITGFVRGACSNGLANTSDGLPADGQSFGCFGLGHTQYVQAIGTSASAPLVAGAAAILAAAHPTWTPTQIIQTLKTSASALPSISNPVLNLPAALSLQ